MFCIIKFKTKLLEKTRKTWNRVVLPVAYSRLDETGCLPPSASFIVHGYTSSLDYFGSTLFAGIAILGTCRAYSTGTHARKEEDGLLLEFTCNPTRTHSM
jgi:hypothetical protein